MSAFRFTLPRASGTSELAERRFRDLVHDVDGIVWELEPATQRFTFVSRRAEELLGHPIERWLAARDFSSTLIDARDRERAHAAYADAARGAGVVDHEFRATAADGRIVWLRDRVHRTESGRLRGLMVDVTEQKRLEQERDELLLREQMARAEVEAAVGMVQRLWSITEAALTHRSLDELVKTILERIRDVVEADTTVILLPTDDGAHLAVAGAIGLEPDLTVALRVPINGDLTGRIAAGGEPLVVDDPATELDIPALRDSRVRSQVRVWLSADGDFVGIVHAARRGQRAFTAEEARLLQLVGDRVGTAIRNARLHDHAQRIRQRTAFLADATTALFNARTPASALDAVARLAVPLVADWCVVDLRERDGGYRRVTLAHRDADAERAAAPLLGTLASAPAASGALARALRERSAQWCPAGAAVGELETRGGSDERAVLAQLGVGGYVCVPLVARRRVLGAMTLVRAHGQRRFEDDDVRLASELARRAAVAVDERRRRRETRELLRLSARLVSGALELARAPLSLVEVVQAAARAVTAEARAKNVGIELHDGANDLNHVRVSGDERRLRQVCQRLLEGALRVAPTDGRVRVGLARDAGFAVLSVSTGPASGGLLAGMRLAIVRRLVELHGGTATMTRAEDGTRTVRMRLPLLA
ncbi:MAG TPA: GAF domain-containing protein [Methylomirabilota bacterium]|nr:GAF domain-containing protein [Methylomirabilota bacterium]